MRLRSAPAAVVATAVAVHRSAGKPKSCLRAGRQCLTGIGARPFSLPEVFNRSLFSWVRAITEAAAARSTRGHLANRAPRTRRRKSVGRPRSPRAADSGCERPPRSLEARERIRGRPRTRGALAPEAVTDEFQRRALVRGQLGVARLQRPR